MPEPQKHRQYSFALLVLAIAAFAGSWFFLFMTLEVETASKQHLPAILWILLETVALGLFIGFLWQRKKYRQLQREQQGIDVDSEL